MRRVIVDKEICAMSDAVKAIESIDYSGEARIRALDWLVKRICGNNYIITKSKNPNNT